MLTRASRSLRTGRSPRASNSAEPCTVMDAISSMRWPSFARKLKQASITA